MSDDNTVAHIVKIWLEDHPEYDGLVSPSNCACLTTDLEPCGEMRNDCVAGHKIECECGEGCDFDIKPGQRPDGIECSESSDK